VKATVRDVMSTHVISARTTASFKEIATRLREFRVSAFPVLDREGKVIGVVSEADMLPKEALAGEEGMSGIFTGILHRKEQEKAEGITAADLMTSPAVTVAPEDTIDHAARLMYERKIRRLPVVDADNRLLGIISLTDVLSVFDRPDEEIRDEISREAIPALADPARYSVTVKDGIVTLEGTPEDATQARDVLARVRRVQGVVAVRDRLTYPPDKDAPR
jgi:CBS domain-containing protein